MMNGAQYMASLKARRPRVFYKGKRLEDPYDHPAIAPHVRAAAATYDLATDGGHDDRMTAVSTLTGEKISRFTHLFSSADDLVKKIAMLRLVDRKRERASSDALDSTGSTRSGRSPTRSTGRRGRVTTAGSGRSLKRSRGKT